MRYYTRYIIIGILLLVVFFFGFRFAWRLVFRRTGTPAQPKVVLTNYITPDSYVRLTMRGIVNSEEHHRNIRITVSQSQRSIDILQGYQNHLLKSETLDNNASAYDVFMHALQRQNFTGIRNDRSADSTGACSLGNVFTYELVNGSQQVLQSWSATCSALGTYTGNTPNTLTLFQRQIPDYGKFIQGVSLSTP